MKKIDSENKNRPEGKNMVLVYGFEKDELKKLKNIVEHTKIDEINILPEKSYKMTIRDLINHKYIKLDEKESPQILDLKVIEKLKIRNIEKINKPKLVLFNAVSNYELDTAVNYIKKEFENIPLIAMVTKVSINWKLSELLIELNNERKEFSKK